MALTTYLPAATPGYILPSNPAYIPTPVQQDVTYTQNGYTSDVTKTSFPLQKGVPLTAPYMFKVIPASVSSNCISPANAYIAAGQPLNTVTQGTAPNITARAITFNNQPCLLLDCERVLSITLTGGGATSFFNSVLTITGYVVGDGGLIPCTASTELTQESFTDNSTFCSCAISVVTGVSFSNSFQLSGQPAVYASIGTTQVIGLPYLLTNLSYIQSLYWNNTAFAITNVIPGLNWRTQEVDALTNNPRGVVVLPTNPNGAMQLSMCYVVTGMDSELNAELQNKNQSSLKLLGVQKSASSAYPNPNLLYPNLTKYDLRGIVYPGDNAFLQSYSQALAS